MEKIYFGTSVKNTFDLIYKINNYNFGICLNLFKYDNSFIKKFNYLEKKQMNIFLDNGSFERFKMFLKNEINAENYFNINNSRAFFNQITKNYENILNKSINPKNIILTIPEIIGNSEITQILQKEFKLKYHKFKQKFNCKIIVSLQFNPKKDWVDEIENGAKFIKNNFDNSYIVGIPFGNDFRVLHNKRSFDIVINIFHSILNTYKAHLFACGSIPKIKNFVLKNQNFIYSIDASSIMNIAKYSHYLSKQSHKVLDIRALKGKTVKYETMIKKQQELYNDSNLTLEQWCKIKYINRFEKIISNFNQIIIYINLI